MFLFLEHMHCAAGTYMHESLPLLSSFLHFLQNVLFYKKEEHFTSYWHPRTFKIIGGYRRRIGAAKFNIGGANSTSKQYEVSPLVEPHSSLKFSPTEVRRSYTSGTEASAGNKPHTKNASRYVMPNSGSIELHESHSLK